MIRELLDSGFIYWVLLFFVVALIDVIVGIAGLRRRTKYSKAVARVMFAATATGLFYTFSIATEIYKVSSFFSSLYFISVDFLLLCMAEFVGRFTASRNMYGKGYFVRHSLLTMVLLDTVVLLINPFKEIAISYKGVLLNGHMVYTYQAGVLYNLHLALCYVMVGVIVCMLVMATLRAPSLYKSRYLEILFTFGFVIVLNALFLFWNSIIMLDVSILFYSLAGILIYFSVFVFNPKTLINNVKVFVFENIDNAIIALDDGECLIEANDAAKEMFPELSSRQFKEKSREEVHRYFTDQGLGEMFGDKETFKWSFYEDEEERSFSCTRKNFFDKKNRPLGEIFIITDVSYRKDSITGFNYAPGMFKYLRSINSEDNYPIQLLSMNINGLGMINSAFGHGLGNEVMAAVAKCIKDVKPADSRAFKLEDGTIMLVIKKCENGAANNIAKAIKAKVSEVKDFNFSVELEYGMSEVYKENSDIYDAINESHRSMKNRKLLSAGSQGSSLILSLTQGLLESDFETEAHVERTKEVSKHLGMAMGLSDSQISQLALLCILHDIGKIGIPSEILLKPGKLSDEEWAVMKTHSEKGYRIAMASKELEPIADLILHHHERWDGKGYPSGLKGEEIPLLSRIITVLDSFDVMTHDRPYHKAVSIEAAKEELRLCSGTQFDPNIVQAFLQLIEEAQEVARK